MVGWYRLWVDRLLQVVLGKLVGLAEFFALPYELHPQQRLRGLDLHEVDFLDGLLDCRGEGRQKSGGLLVDEPFLDHFDVQITIIKPTQFFIHGNTCFISKLISDI